jgi:tetratricopeptide (TPR) repeat protein
LYGQGKVDEAIEYYKKAIDIDPRFALAYNNLGLALYSEGKVDEAIECYKNAIALDEKLATAHHNLGQAWEDKGKVDEAIECYKNAIALDEKLAHAHGALGRALMLQGELIAAQKSFHRCLALLPANHPIRDLTAQLLGKCEQWLDADPKLKAYLAGKGAPADAVTLVSMASLAQQPFNRLYLIAARLYRDAFARQPQLADAHRYNAARAAALAGTGQGTDVARLDDTARAEMRSRALSRLQDDLSAHARELDSNQPGTAQQVRRKLQDRRMDADLAAVRDPDALRKLPEAEQAAWRNLWAQVDALLARTGPGK